ncbi:hypothetical protein HK405_015678, partial [Cladochytrium tenue]
MGKGGSGSGAPPRKGGKLNKVKRGGPRQFTSPEEVERRGAASDGSGSGSGSDDDSSDGAPSKPVAPRKPATGGSSSRRPPAAVSSGSDSDDDDHDIVNKVVGKVEGHARVQSFGKPTKEQAAEVEEFEVANPNKAPPKPGDGPAPLSRREREAIERERAHEHHLRMQMEGRTEQARNDLARLAIIRKQREDAARKKVEEQS